MTSNTWKKKEGKRRWRRGVHTRRWTRRRTGLWREDEVEQARRDHDVVILYRHANTTTNSNVSQWMDSVVAKARHDASVSPPSRPMPSQNPTATESLRRRRRTREAVTRAVYGNATVRHKEEKENTPPPAANVVREVLAILRLLDKLSTTRRRTKVWRCSNLLKQAESYEQS